MSILFGAYLLIYDLKYRMYRTKSKSARENIFNVESLSRCNFYSFVFAIRSVEMFKGAERKKTENLHNHFSLKTILSRNKVCWIVG